MGEKVNGDGQWQDVCGELLCCAVDIDFLFSCKFPEFSYMTLHHEMSRNVPSLLLQ